MRTQIDIPELRAIGDRVGRVAATMDAEATAIEGWAYAGQDAVEGSLACAGEVIVAAHAWSRELAELAASVHDYGNDLKQTANDYESYDRLHAQQLRQIGDPTFGKAYY